MQIYNKIFICAMQRYDISQEGMISATSIMVQISILTI